MGEYLISMGPAMANHLWQSTAFAAVVWAAALLLRRNQARVRYAVWLVASAKFLVPFALLISLGGMLPRPQHAVVTMPVYSAVDEVGLPFEEGMPVTNVAATHVSEARHGAPDLLVTLPVVVAGIWLCGVVVVVGVWGARWLRVVRVARAAVRVESGREADLLRQVAARIGGQRVRLALSEEPMEPGVFGVFRPVLIWPLRLSERLDDAHIEAIVAHELMHVRRRDNLTAVLHMLVEAAFWFHPAVWWMGARLVEERERACDEAVVEMGSRPGVYAESLLKAVRFCVESPLACVAGVTGADLKQRVRSIMTLRMKRLGVAGKVALAALAVGMVAGPVAFGVVRMIPLVGQVLKATGPLPSYAFVVIKPSQDTAHGADMQGEQTHYLVTAKMLIQFAYGVFNPPKMNNLEVVGGPDWINTDVFDIVGKVSPEEFEQRQKMNRAQGHEQRQLMEQSLLAERFKLKMHTEMRDQPVYSLTVGKNLKLTPAKDATGGAHVNPYPGSTTPDQLKRGLVVQAKGRNFVMTVKGMTLDTFVDALMAQKEVNNKPVVNQTGLTEAYDFTLTWGPEDLASPESGDEALEPPLFTAMQQQLGLKMADAKAPAEVVVIDHIEKPVFDNADAPAKQSVVASAVAAGQQMLAKLVPAALVQQKPAPEGAIRPADGAPHGINWTAIRQPDAPAELCCGGGGFEDVISGARVNSRSDKGIYFFRLGWAYVLPTGLEFQIGETVVPYNGMPPHGTYGVPDQKVDSRGQLMRVIVFFEQVMLDGGTNYRADHKQIEAWFASQTSGWAAAARAAVQGAGANANAIPPIKFEVVSIRRNISGSREMTRQSAANTDNITMTNVPLALMVLYAYHINDQNLAIGVPDWAWGERYDLVAKVAPSDLAAYRALSNQQRGAMLQYVLAERFKLQVHQEMQDKQAYALVAAKGAAKLKETTLGEPTPGAPAASGFAHGSTIHVVHQGELSGQAASMADLAVALSNIGAESLGRVVVDRTGLTGRYDFTLKWASVDDPKDTDGPSLFTAIQEQLGMKLESTKAPMDVLVIDHIEKPSEN